ncbi:hypothetical protein [Sinomonas mesophila]|uniref:hypothetical protein n=1 Tax=Sinomonas mesophila TaxID=1531955 RepID=UPI0011159FAC|nr:hypothetical protein [Sinomonas mesophila]
MEGQTTSRIFRVALLAESAAVFPVDDDWKIQMPDDSGRRVHLTALTRYVGDETLHTARELVCHFEIEADHIDEAIAIGTEASSWLLPIMAFAANAEIGEPRPHVAYELARSETGREFLQFYRVFRDDEAPQRSRFIHKGSTEAVVAAISGNEEEQRLWRCLSQYAFALENWTFGNEFLALNHLWIGVENLSKATLRNKCRNSGITEGQLAESYGLDPADRNWRRDLLTAVRLHLIFQSDQSTHQRARAVSDGFEHGFRPASELQSAAAEICPRVFAYLRQAVLDVLELKPEIASAIMARDPLDWRSAHKFIRGWLVGDPDDDRLGSPEVLYPQLNWGTVLKEMKIHEDESISYTYDENLTPMLGIGMGFKLRGLGASWRPLNHDRQGLNQPGQSEGE